VDTFAGRDLNSHFRLSGKPKLLKKTPVGAAFLPRIKTIAAGKPLPQNPIHLFFPDNRILMYKTLSLSGQSVK
jgi:hypothetical protein